VPTMAGWTLSSLPWYARQRPNPEQLLAGGWPPVIDRRSRLSRAKKVTLPDNAAVDVDVEVDLGIWHGFHGPAARPDLNLPGLDKTVAQRTGAHPALSILRAARDRRRSQRCLS
jgi:hypothetical protein